MARRAGLEERLSCCALESFLEMPLWKGEKTSMVIFSILLVGGEVWLERFIFFQKKAVVIFIPLLFSLDKTYETISSRSMLYETVWAVLSFQK